MPSQREVLEITSLWSYVIQRKLCSAPQIFPFKVSKTGKVPNTGFHCGTNKHIKSFTHNFLYCAGCQWLRKPKKMLRLILAGN